MHEKLHNKQDERAIAHACAEKWGLSLTEAPAFCVVDGCFFKDSSPYAFFEVKKRNYRLCNLNDVWIDKDKLNKAFGGASEAGVGLVLLFHFDDGVFCCPIKQWPDFQTKLGGPAKKRDAHDTDELYLIPQASWQKVLPPFSSFSAAHAGNPSQG